MTQTNDIKLQEGIDYGLLEEARKDRKWSIAQTAEYCDVPESTTKNILNGTTLNPGADSLGKLCRGLGVPIEKVLRQDEQKEIEKQGRQQYLSGNYELGVLNLQGQRISIRVTIPRKNGTGEVSFITGWMVKPGGKIKLNTPYGGK